MEVAGGARRVGARHTGGGGCVLQGTFYTGEALGTISCGDGGGNVRNLGRTPSLEATGDIKG